MDIEREGAILAHRLAIAKVDAETRAHERRVEMFYDSLADVLEGVQCDDDLDLEEFALVLDEMRALDRAGCLPLSPETREAIFTRFASITALDAHPNAADAIVGGEMSMN